MAEFVYPPVIRTALSLYKVLNLTLDGHGWQHIPARGGAIIASNHISYLDFILAGTPPFLEHRRLTRFMAKESVFRNRVSGPLMRGMHHIPVDREAGSMSFAEAERRLRSGELVGMFPEGTISQSFTVKPLKTGAVRLAQSAGVPLLPMAIWGTQRFWTKNRARRLFRGHTVTIMIGEPMQVAAGADISEANQDLAQRLQTLLDEAQRRHPDTATATPGAWWLPRHLGGSAPTPQEAAAADAAELADRRARRQRETGESPSGS